MCASRRKRDLAYADGTRACRAGPSRADFDAYNVMAGLTATLRPSPSSLNVQQPTCCAEPAACP